MKYLLLAVSLFCTLIPYPAAAQDAKQALMQKLSTVKESIARNQAALRQYTWT